MGGTGNRKSARGIVRISRQTTYRLIATAALGLGLWAFVHQAELSALPADFDLAGVVWPVRMEGVEVGSADQARFLVEGYPAESVIGIEPPDPGQPPGEVTLVAAYHRSYLLVTLISGLFFWAVAAFVFAPRVDQPAVPLFFWISILYGTGVFVGGVYGQSDPGGWSLLRPLMQLTSLAFLPAAFLHLSLAFPTASPLLRRRPWLPLVLYLMALAVVLWQGTAFLAYFRQPCPAAWSRLNPPQAVADSLLILQVVAGFSVLVTRVARLEEARQRQQIRWLILGFLVGSAPYVFFRTLPNLFGAPALFPAYFDRILELAVPTGFVLAVVRYRFLDIDIILRRGLIYGFLAALLVALVVLPVLLVGPAWSDPWPAWWRIVVILCGVTAGILFRPLHEIIGRGVDRAFFKIEREFEKILLELQGELDAAVDLHDLAARLGQGVQGTLHLDRCLVAISDGPEIITAGDGWEHSREALAEILAQVDFSGPTIPAPLDEAGFVTIQRLGNEDDPAGALFLGPKTTGRLFIPGDREFLRRSSTLAMRRLKQVRLARTVAGERLKRRQLNELSRLKDDFLSRVAHDLRTPVTSMGWSIRNLKDGLAGDLNPKQREYLSSLGDSADHLAGLVTSLLEISRLENAKVEVACEPLDTAGAVKRAVGTVRPLAEAKAVDLATIFRKPGLAVANEDKLTEVLVNLLENAVRFSPETGRIQVTVDSPDQAWVRITVRDDGPGLGGLDDPFGRFVQGKPSPDGARGGYGLGLTIAREYVVLMGGEIRGEDHPAGGAVFTIELARVENPAGEQS